MLSGDKYAVEIYLGKEIFKKVKQIQIQLTEAKTFPGAKTGAGAGAAARGAGER